MNSVDGNISPKLVESLSTQAEPELGLVELNPQEEIDFTNEQERKKYYSELSEQAKAVKMMLKNSLYNLNNSNQLIEFSKKIKTPKLLLELSLNNFDQTYKKLTHTLIEDGDTSQLIGSLNRYYDEIQLQIEKLNDIVSTMTEEIESLPGEQTEISVSSKSENLIPVLNSKPETPTTGQPTEQSIEDLPVNLPTGPISNDLESVLKTSSLVNQEVNIDSKAGLIRQTLKEMVDRPFTAEELLTQTAYEESVRPYVLASLMAENISPVKAEAQVIKSLDLVIGQINKQGTAPGKIAEDVNRIIKNIYLEIEKGKQLTQEKSVASNFNDELTVVKTESIKTDLDLTVLLAEIDKRITKLKLLSSEADLTPLEEIKNQVANFNEPDQTVRKNILHKYEVKFSELADELEAGLVSISDQTTETNLQGSKTLTPLQLTPEMRVEAENTYHQNEESKITDIDLSAKIETETDPIQTESINKNSLEQSLQTAKDNLNAQRKEFLDKRENNLLQSFDKASLWFRKNKRAVRNLGLAAILAEATVIGATIGTQKIEANFDSTPKIETNNPQPETPELTTLRRTVGFSKDNRVNNSVEQNKIFSDKVTAVNFGPVNGVNLPNDLEVKTEDLTLDTIYYSKKITPISNIVPGVELPKVDVSPSFSNEQIKSVAETEPSIAEASYSYKAESGDNYWNIMEGQTKAGLMLWQTMVDPKYTQIVIDKVKTLIDADSELRNSLGFGDSTNKLLTGSTIDLKQLDKLATKIIVENNYLQTDADSNIEKVNQDSDPSIRILEGDKLFDIIDKNVLPTLSSMPTFEQQAVLADIKKTLINLSPMEVKAMGIESGNLNNIKPGEKISLLKVKEMADLALSNRWESKTTATKNIDNVSPTQEIESIITGEKLMVTDSIAKHFIDTYPGGTASFDKDFLNYVERIQGGNPEGGWLSSIFAPDSRTNVFKVLKDVTVAEINTVISMTKSELMGVLKHNNIRLADFETWRNQYEKIISEKTVSIGDPTKTTFGEIIKRGFIALKSNELLN